MVLHSFGEAEQAIAPINRIEVLVNHCRSPSTGPLDMVVYMQNDVVSTIV